MTRKAVLTQGNIFLSLVFSSKTRLDGLYMNGDQIVFATKLSIGLFQTKIVNKFQQHRYQILPVTITRITKEVYLISGRIFHKSTDIINWLLRVSLNVNILSKSHAHCKLFYFTIEIWLPQFVSCLNIGKLPFLGNMIC